MNIRCYVCNEVEASVYCTADEASLCAACDHRVHQANKLASKHPRFSFIPSTPKDYPFCDICQEKRAFLFCQQDRAILCKDCDEAIHKVNQHTQNHNRFLLTGVKLSSARATIHSTQESFITDQPKSRDQKEASSVKKPAELAASVHPPNQATLKTQKVKVGLTAPNGDEKSNGSGQSPTTTTSSISEYLIEMLPGWHVEDFLDSPPNFDQIVDNDAIPFWNDNLLDGNLNNNIISSHPQERMGIWVPQAPPPAAAQVLPPPDSRTPLFQQLPAAPVFRTTLFQQHPDPDLDIGFGSQPPMNGVFATTKLSRKRRADEGNCFTVPQMNLPPTNMTISKRPRMLGQ